MKLYNKNKLLPAIIICNCFLLSIIINGCTKPGDTFETFESASLRVINGLPGPAGIKFYLDTFNITTTGNTNYGTTSQYFVVKAGSRNAAFFSTVAADTFARSNIQLDAKKSYTLFLPGSVGDAKPILTEDDPSATTPDKVKLRLANLGATVTNVDVTIQLEDLITDPQPKPEVQVFSNVAPASISDYTTAAVPTSKGNAIPQKHTIRVYETGTQNVVAQATGVDLRGTTTNTIIINGIKDGAPALALRSNIEWLDW